MNFRLIALSLGLIVLSSMAEAKMVCADDLYNQISLEVQNDKMVIQLSGKVSEKLNIQLRSEDGLILWANPYVKQERPMTGAKLRNSSVLITFKDSDQAMLQYRKNSYLITCSQKSE